MLHSKFILGESDMGFSLFGNSEKKTSSIWTLLSEYEELDSIFISSFERPQLIFKHSTRCGISTIVLRNFENEWDDSSHEGSLHFLDILAHREISDAIAERTAVRHQSPQILIVFRGNCLYDASHHSISASRIYEKMKQVI